MSKYDVSERGSSNFETFFFVMIPNNSAFCRAVSYWNLWRNKWTTKFKIWFLQNATLLLGS